MSDDTAAEWPREIWMAEREEYDQGVVSARTAQDEHHDHCYIDSDIYDSAEKYWRARAEAAEACVNSRAAIDVLAERARQVSDEGWTPEHDDQWHGGQLAAAATTYIEWGTSPEVKARPPLGWPWAWSRWKPRSYRRNLVRAAALLIAEIERLDRAALKDTEDRE